MMNRIERTNGPECPRCGCTDTAVLKRPSAAWMQGSGRAKCRNCGESFGIASMTPPPVDHAEPLIDHAEPDVPESRAVRYQILLCPDCGSERTKVTNTRRPLRSHKCKDCGATFQTVEQKVRATRNGKHQTREFSDDISIP